MTTNEHSTIVYIGTYTRREPPPAGVSWNYQGRGDGIYVYQLDRASGALTHIDTATEAVNPSFLALHPQQRTLYAVNQVVTFGAEPGGAVSAFATDPENGTLTYLNQQPSGGTGPAHLAVNADGTFVLVANYRSGSAAMLPIDADGRLGAPTDTVQHSGSSVNAQRQEGPHAHSVTLDPTNRYAIIADLGMDKLMVYELDWARGAFTPQEAAHVTMTPGAGPRHTAFHPDGRTFYVINELNSTVTAFAFDASSGALRELQTISTLPDGFTETNTCAEICVHPTGRFLYGSNRGHDSIVIYAIDGEMGTLTYMGHESTRGHGPRNFALDPSGTFLLAANQQSDTVVVFRIDPQTGLLSSTGHAIDVPTPVCVKMIDLKGRTD